jgi:hypothetical protein
VGELDGRPDRVEQLELLDVGECVAAAAEGPDMQRPWSSRWSNTMMTGERRGGWSAADMLYLFG